MKKLSVTVAGIAMVAILAFTSTAWATVLNFSATPSIPSVKPFADAAFDSLSEYGDRVDATFQQLSPYHSLPAPAGWQGTYMYGSAGGATPNVVVSYATPAPIATPRYYAASSNGTGAAYFEASGGVSPDVLIDFIADAGYTVTLESLEMIDWGTTAIKTLKVLAADLTTVLWDSGATAGTPIAMASGQVRPFSINVSDTTLRLVMAENNTTTNLGVDNIQFSQVPEPATLALLALGGLAMLRRRQ